MYAIVVNFNRRYNRSVNMSHFDSIIEFILGEYCLVFLSSLNFTFLLSCNIIDYFSCERIDLQNKI